jgi:ribonuclease G
MEISRDNLNDKDVKKVRREILMQVLNDETKVAVLEDGQLVEIYAERNVNQRVVGNIYKGVVKNVLPGMQAAFVDIGLEKNAFLYVMDAAPQPKAEWDAKDRTNKMPLPNIRDLVKEGQEIVVQIVKEPVGTKGARITAQLTIPGRWLVLMPTVDYVAISRRILNETERIRLKDVAQSLKPEGMGLIVRTVAEGAQPEELERDVKQLLKIWEGILSKQHKSSAPVLIHEDLELYQRILRDIFSDEVVRLFVNSRAVHDKVMEFVDMMEPRLKGKVYVNNIADLFEKYSVNEELTQALNRKVWLKNGGYLIFDHTEALTAVDVNTGKYVGSTNLADTVLKTNLEAAREIARQLKLRNVGGIIIIDFIDMQDNGHKAQVLEYLQEEFKKDKVRTHILGITSLGLVEVTRKKVRQSLSSTLEEICPHCNGKGRIMSDTRFLKDMSAR